MLPHSGRYDLRDIDRVGNVCAVKIGTRILWRDDAYRHGPLYEGTVLEVSPSKRWVKLQNTSGDTFWKDRVKVNVIEVLEDTGVINAIEPEGGEMQ